MKKSGFVLSQRGVGHTRINRALAMLMCLLMLVGLVPTQAFAALADGETVISVAAPANKYYEVGVGTALEAVGLPGELSVSVLVPAAEEGGESSTREESAAVTWTGGYDGGTPGSYSLTADFIDGHSFDGSMPTVTVAVREAAAAPVEEEPVAEPEDEPQADSEAPVEECACDPKPGEGEAHQESCPLYVALKSGEIAPLLAPESSEVCTCDPKPEEGAAHQENCPLYVAPIVPLSGGENALTPLTFTLPTLECNLDGLLTRSDFSTTFTATIGAVGMGKMLEGGGLMLDEVPIPMPATTTVSTPAFTGESTQNFGEFGTVTFTAPGGYIYSFTQTVGSEVGVTYDKSQFWIFVAVEEVNGVLTATSEIRRYKTKAGEIQGLVLETGPIRFMNEYWPEGAKWQVIAPLITLTVAQGNTLPQNYSEKFYPAIFLRNGAQELMKGESPEFTAAGSQRCKDIPVVTSTGVGEQIYYIRQWEETTPGMSYSKAEYKATFTLVDDKGQLKLTGPIVYTRTKNDAGEAVNETVTDIVFNNIYKEPNNVYSTLTCSSDANGSITEWMLKGDADRDHTVSDADTRRITDISFGTYTESDLLAREAADLNADGHIDGGDYAALVTLAAGTISLPNAMFTYRVVDTPKAGYTLDSVLISSSDGAGVTLSPWVLSSGGYTLSIDGNGVATVTGPSHTTDTVKFNHISSKDYITLTSGSDANGTITETMLKGDADGSRGVNYLDISCIYGYMAGRNTVDAESADSTNDGKVNTMDITQLYRLFQDGVTLPNDDFTFRVVDRPSVGYRVASAVITTPDGKVTLTPAAPTSGSYTLDLAPLGHATVTGQSLATNDVQFTHEPLEPAITLTYGSDANGSVTEWMLKGDANRDGRVDTDAEMLTLSEYLAGKVTLTELGKESADSNGDNKITIADINTLSSLGAGTITLPNDDFTFRVVDRPSVGYRVASAVITTPDGKVTLTSAVPTNGNYTLAIAADGVATVTGQSLATNDVQVTHEAIEPAITLSYGSDANGSISEWMLKGDANRDGKVDYPTDVGAIQRYMAGVLQLDALASESADASSDGIVNAYDTGVIASIYPGGRITLPDARFTFRVMDTPNSGYKVKAAVITTPTGKVTLTPAAPTSGGYTLAIADDRVATVTGQSLKKNDVQFAHEAASKGIALTYGSDANGSVTEWMLKGDVDRDGVVNSVSEVTTIIRVINQVQTLPDAITRECADVDSNGFINGQDATLLLQLLNGVRTLPDPSFTFRVKDKPNAGYKAAAAVITTPDGIVTLTPAAPTSGSYALAIAADGVATVTGQSLATNDVQFTHVLANAPAALITAAELNVKKTVAGQPMLEAKTFTITRTDGGAADAVTMPAQTSITTAAITFGDAAVIGFGSIAFNEAGTYSFSIAETATGIPGMVDAAAQTVTVKVTDTNGALSAAIVTNATSNALASGALTFVNTYTLLTGQLTVSNTVTGDLGDRNKDFAFKIIFDASGRYSFTGSKSGTIASGDTVLLKHGEFVTVSGLPAGTTYSVTESGNSGYRVYSSGDVGVIAANQTSTAAFTNSRSKVPITGDDGSLFTGLMLMLFSLVGGATLLLADMRIKRGRRGAKGAR